MANKINAKQVYIDSVVAQGPTTTIKERLFKGDVVQWNLTGGAAGNQAVLQSEDGTLIYNGLASGANYVDRFQLPRDYFDGFYVPTLSAGGVITITHRSGRVS
jgi:hypothetical protein